jgi:hypothetical protein
MSTNINAHMAPVKKHPEKISPDFDELNINQLETDQPNINHPAVDEPKTGDHDNVKSGSIEELPHRQMQAEFFDTHDTSDDPHHRPQTEAGVAVKDLAKVQVQVDERSTSSYGKSNGAKPR